MRKLPVVAGCLAAAGLACLAAAPQARSFTPPEPATIADPIGDVPPGPDEGRPRPDIVSVTVSQRDPETLRLVVAFAEPLVLRESAPVVEDGVRVMLGHPQGDRTYQDLAAWVGAADPSRVLVTDLAEPWHPGSVVRGGSARVDGRTLTLSIATEALRARARAGQPVDPDLPVTWSVHTSLGWAAAGPAGAMDIVEAGDAAPDVGDMEPFSWSGRANDTALSRALSAGGGALIALAVVLLLGPPARAGKLRRLERQRQEALDRPTFDEEFADVELLSSGT